ncbi:phage head-tail adaptor, putative, SPP1 family [Loktanella atrilutea]|uniref:Phage head-tail adaptor, putative, SPP1 family n=1 Tax=Loktanella atrilutea TaxID=366533 RepID=A0A1M5DKM1_LOKAT|nr:phage head closure protein [Loktanella atrilutea]SHF67454.1 phage head-tail adaptor, putative, SPP1 family [Loktanella atrilutea]
MEAGSLRDRITFQRLLETDGTASVSAEVDEFGNPVPGADEFGNIAASHQDLFTVWADVRETTGKERLAAGRIEASRTATIRVRRTVQTRAIKESDQIRARGENWNIRSMIAVGNSGEAIEFLCEAGVAG